MQSTKDALELSQVEIVRQYKAAITDHLGKIKSDLKEAQTMNMETDESVCMITKKLDEIVDRKVQEDAIYYL